MDKPADRPDRQESLGQTQDVHPTQITNARLWLLQGNLAAASNSLRTDAPRIVREHGEVYNIATAWYILRAEIASQQNNFDDAIRFCNAGLSLDRPYSTTRPHPLYNAILRSMRAEAGRRTNPLDTATIDDLETLLTETQALHQQTGDKRFLFVQYAALRTLALDLREDDAEAAALYSEAADDARADFMQVPVIASEGKTVPRRTYADMTANAQADQDKLTDPQASPDFVAVMSLPFNQYQGI